MKRSEDQFLRVIDSVYASALGEVEWSESLRAMTDHFDAVGGWIFDLDRRSGEIEQWIAYRIDKTAAEWVERVKSIDPRVRYTFSHAAGEVDHDALFISEREMDRHEFYDWQLKGAGTRYFVGTRMRDGARRSSFIALTFTPKHGPVAEAKLRSFGRLSRHVGNAWQLWNRVQAGDRDSRLPAFISERIPWGVITLDSGGRVLAMNSRAEQILASHDGLGIDQGQLFAQRSVDNRVLQNHIASALRADDRTPQAGAAAQIARKSGRPGYVLQVLPCPAADCSPRAVVYIADPARPIDLDPGSLASAFKLTGREAALAILLANGSNLAQAAEQMEISYNTARVHLQNVFRKTETCNQSGLIRLLALMIGRAG